MRSEYAKYQARIQPFVVEAAGRLGLSCTGSTGSRITHRQFSRDPFRGEFWLDFRTESQRLLVSWQVNRSNPVPGDVPGVVVKIHIAKP